MKKIVIIGSPGAGKTTLAKRLHSILGIKVFHLDRLFWKSGWKRKSKDERIGILQAIIEEKQWIIEGTYLRSAEPRLTVADTIIFLDISPLLCLQRIFKRHHELRGQPRRDIPLGCTDELNIFRVLKVLVFPFRGRRKLEKKLYCCEENKQIIRLCSVQEVEDFLLQVEQDVKEKSRLVIVG